jgi:hypothetical protein
MSESLAKLGISFPDERHVPLRGLGLDENWLPLFAQNLYWSLTDTDRRLVRSAPGLGERVQWHRQPFLEFQRDIACVADSWHCIENHSPLLSGVQWCETPIHHAVSMGTTVSPVQMCQLNP